MKERKGYSGRISNGGAQYVEAPEKKGGGKSAKVIKGDDLRSKKSKK